MAKILNEYCDKISQIYGSVVFLVKVKKSYFVEHLQVVASEFGLLRTAKIFSLSVNQ